MRRAYIIMILTCAPDYWRARVYNDVDVRAYIIIWALVYIYRRACVYIYIYIYIYIGARVYIDAPRHALVRDSRYNYI